MARPRKHHNDLVVDPADFPTFLKARMGGRTVAQFAKELGISENLLYVLLAGSRKPSAAVLKKLGLKIAYQLVLVAKGKERA
jgi:hypothetical protein